MLYLYRGSGLKLKNEAKSMALFQHFCWLWKCIGAQSTALTTITDLEFHNIVESGIGIRKNNFTNYYYYSSSLATNIYSWQNDKHVIGSPVTLLENIFI